MSTRNSGHVVVPKKRFSHLDFWREVLTASRFGLVGVSATVVHIMVVWLLLKQAGLTPISANTLAFLTAFGVSFTGNYLWTFGSPGKPWRAIIRYLFIAVSAFSVNTTILVFLVYGGWFSVLSSAVFSAAIVPVVSYSASRLWGFEK
jgi:putative flippase GtrA